MSHLLDTDACISILRGHDPVARTRLSQMSRVAVCSVTVAELAYGAARSQAPAANKDEVHRFIASVDVVDLDQLSAWHSGDIRAALATKGTPIGGYDLLIAGVARAHDLTLVTGNVREFERVPGLRVEGW